MAADYYRIDLRIPIAWSVELEKLKQEAYEKTGKRVSKSDLIREMMKPFLEIPSSSCFSSNKKS